MFVVSYTGVRVSGSFGRWWLVGSLPFFFCSNSLKVFQVVPVKLTFSYKASVFNVLLFHFLKSGLGDQ